MRLSFSSLAVAIAAAGACGGGGPGKPPPVPTPSPVYRAVLTDRIGDSCCAPPHYPFVPADLASGTIEVRDKTLRFSVRLAPGTFDKNTSAIFMDMDTDQNPTTGFSNPVTGGVGVDYSVALGLAKDGGEARVIRFDSNDSGRFSDVGVVAETLLADGVDVTIPMSMLGNGDGKMNVRVGVSYQSANYASNNLDYMPDRNLPMAAVQ